MTNITTTGGGGDSDNATGNAALLYEDPLPRQSIVTQLHRQRRTRTRTRTRTRIGGNGSTRCNNNLCLVVALVALVASWAICFVLVWKTTISSPVVSIPISIPAVPNHQPRSSGGVPEVVPIIDETRKAATTDRHNNKNNNNNNKESNDHDNGNNNNNAGLHRPPKHPGAPHLLSRKPNNVVATSDVRGNLGPAAVVLQAHPGTDWIHDRWQAASDMHGSQIPGSHWIQLEFVDGPVVPTTIVLDWETAYADEYVLEASSLRAFPDNNGDGSSSLLPPDTRILFDGRDPASVESMRSVTESGRSPGVKEARPLHIVHEIRLGMDSRNDLPPVRYLRLRILKSVTGWGVSLWQFDVYGYRSNDPQTAR